MTEQVDCAVIGAGVVGLAIARRMAMAEGEVVILEDEEAFGTHSSARTFGVMHAGIYYDVGGQVKFARISTGSTASTTVLTKPANRLSMQKSAATAPACPTARRNRVIRGSGPHHRPWGTGAGFRILRSGGAWHSRAA